MAVGVSVCKSCHVRLDMIVPSSGRWNSLEVPASSCVVMEPWSRGGVETTDYVTALPRTNMSFTQN